MKKIDITQHTLVPKHSIISAKEKDELLERYSISLLELPKIRKKDPAIAHLNAKTGDVVKIVRNSVTAGEAIFYRGVV